MSETFLQPLRESVDVLIRTSVEFLPRLLAAVVILVVGYLLARLMRALTVRAVPTLDRLWERLTSRLVFNVHAWSRSAGLALVIAVFMVHSMIAAGLAGATIPIMFTKLGQDPAQSSSIILTTVTDVVGFFSFLGIATLLSGLL